MKRKTMIIGIVFILIIESVFVYNLFKPNKSQILQDIKTVDIFDNKDKTLSIMIQQEDYSYKEDASRTAWPSTSEYLYSGAKCTDKDGNNIANTTPYISFEEISHTVTITTKKTIYCTLYFANGRPALEVLDKQGGEYYGSAETTIGQGEQGNRQVVDGLYRFKGTKDQVTNNYICLGASENPDKCKENKDNMYRIIGVTTDGKLKVIKAVSIGKKAWHDSERYSPVQWNASELYKDINGNNKNNFYGSLDSRIKGVIVKHTWNMEYLRIQGDWPSANPTSDSIKEGTVSNYIGLMYATDYINASPYTSYSDSLNNWLFIQNGLSEITVVEEWTMSRFGLSIGSSPYEAWCISWTGNLYACPVYSTEEVRPVFYLASNVGLVGLGTETSPYTITTIK